MQANIPVTTAMSANINPPEETLDIMRAEFARIASHPEATEAIKELCRRAMLDITTCLPLIQQRDQAQRDALAWERDALGWMKRYNEQTALAVTLAEQRDGFSAKISERKTVHEWLNAKGVPREENGKSLCLLRRLAIALGVHEEDDAAGPSLAPSSVDELRAIIAAREAMLRNHAGVIAGLQAKIETLIAADHGRSKDRLADAAMWRDEREALKARIKVANDNAPSLELSDVRWEYEDSLPEMPDDVFDAMHKASRVDTVRMYPFVEDSRGNRIWITHLP